VALTLALVFAAGGYPPRRLHAHAAPAPDRVTVAQAYTAAWNAHDLDAVLACFAPDAVVRQFRGEVPSDMRDARDPRVVRAYPDDARAGEADEPRILTWVTGHQQIAAWATARFAQHHRFAAAPPLAAGDTVRWQYREFFDPFQRLPGVGALEGSAEAVVRDGRITRLTFVQSPASVQRQRDELAAYGDRRRATVPGPASSGDGSGLQPHGPRRRAAAEPTNLIWPLALGGLALLGVVAAAHRRRRTPVGEANASPEPSQERRHAAVSDGRVK
jgi:ketosteroid isomerase-like protein